METNNLTRKKVRRNSTNINQNNEIKDDSNDIDNNWKEETLLEAHDKNKNNHDARLLLLNTELNEQIKILNNKTEINEIRKLWKIDTSRKSQKK